jgi:hypothetical protein
MTGANSTFWGTMTTAEISGLTSQLAGDKAYDTDKDMIVRYDGTNWLEENSREPITEITDGTTAPGTLKTGGITTRDFDDGGANNSEDVDLTVVVPRHYVPGRQISLRVTYSSAGTAGNAKITSKIDLYQVDDVIGTPGDTVTDSLRSIPASGVANTKEIDANIPVTDGSGLVNATAVVPGDFIRINFLRQGDDAGDNLAGDLRVWSWELTW